MGVGDETHCCQCSKAWGELSHSNTNTLVHTARCNVRPRTHFYRTYNTHTHRCRPRCFDASSVEDCAGWTRPHVSPITTSDISFTSTDRMVWWDGAHSGCSYRRRRRSGAGAEGRNNGIVVVNTTFMVAPAGVPGAMPGSPTKGYGGAFA